MPEPRLSSLNNTRTNPGTLPIADNLKTCKSGKPMPDGSNSSNSREVRSSMKED
jgi:hypothetical protein